MNDGSDGFLSRWARRKAQVRTGALPPEPALPPVEAPKAEVVAERALEPAPADDPPPAAAPLPTLEDVAMLTRDSDYSRFVAPGVDGTVRNAAMKKLFADPHFNVMDGLDTYVDDYGKPDPLPLSMLRKMNQAAFLGLFADEKDREERAAGARAGEERADPRPADSTPATPQLQSDAAAPTLDGTPGVPATDIPPAVPAPRAAPGHHPDEDPDLRLQQDDAAGRPGAEPGPRA
jgi:hypothetical protein